MTRTLILLVCEQKAIASGGVGGYLFAEAAFCIFAFRLRTFSCRALIPSVGVISPSALGVVADAGLSAANFEDGGIVSLGNFVLTWVLLNRRPLDNILLSS